MMMRFEETSQQKKLCFEAGAQSRGREQFVDATRQRTFDNNSLDDNATTDEQMSQDEHFKRGC